MFGTVLHWFLSVPFAYVKGLFFTDFFEIGTLNFSVGDVLIGSLVIVLFIRFVFNRYGIASRTVGASSVREDLSKKGGRKP